MKRKIIKQKSAYTITLPIEWIRDNNLTGADEIEVTNQNNDLVIKQYSLVRYVCEIKSIL